MSTVALPSPDEEIWRYSRIAELDLASYAHRRAAATVTGWTPADTVGPSEPAVDVFAELNAARSEPVVVRIPAGQVVTDPIEVVWAAPADGAVVYPRLVVDAGADSEVTVVERFQSDDVAALVVPVT